ncbi:MAG: hypothetical protein V4472_25170 [Pseudomonadota bacterium]
MDLFIGPDDDGWEGPEERLADRGIRISDCHFCGQDGHRYAECPNRPKYRWPDGLYHQQPYRG